MTALSRLRLLLLGVLLLLVMRELLLLRRRRVVRVPTHLPLHQPQDSDCGDRPGESAGARCPALGGVPYLTTTVLGRVHGRDRDRACLLCASGARRICDDLRTCESLW